MLAGRKFLSCLFFSALAGPYCLWLGHIVSVDNPMWADELITVALVKSASLKHLFSAVLLGLDSTPPLYTGYGWFMLHYVAPGASPELLLRITNAGLIGATIWILYLLVRRYFDQMTALTTIGAFILLELWNLKFLTLEIRTYAALVFFTTLAIYAALRATAQPNWLSLICAMLAYCLLVSSHTFGIIYVSSIVICTVLTAAVESNFSLALQSGLAGMPAIVMFLLWIPVLHSQAQLGNWIPRPDLPSLLKSTYAPANKLRLLAVVLLLAVSTLLWRGIQSRKGRLHWWRPRTRIETFVLLLPVAFGTSIFAVWLFSRLAFPVFLERFFFPDMILNNIWLGILVSSLFNFVTPSKIRYGVVFSSAVAAGAGIIFGRFGVDPEGRVPCFDSSRMTYLEDPFKDRGTIVALSFPAWLTRLNRPGEVVVFPVDESALKKNGTEYPPYVYDTHFIERFSMWLGIKAVMTSAQLLNAKPGFMVLDDGDGPWLKYIQLRHKVKLTPLGNEMKDCTLWRMEKLE